MVLVGGSNVRRRGRMNRGGRTGEVEEVKARRGFLLKKIGT